MTRLTVYDRTRFEITEIRRKEDVPYWEAITRQFNQRYLGGGKQPTSLPELSRSTGTVAAGHTRSTAGRANRGSQRQLQDFVNLFQSELNEAILANMPEPLRGASIHWVSPLQEEDYREYQDEGFLERVGLGDYKAEFAEYWPANGPVWDGLALLEPESPHTQPLILLIEAKGHIPEMRSAGCQASTASLMKIQRALREAQEWVHAKPGTTWTGSIYQSANRIAHLYFIQQRLNRPCILVNLYFVDDPYRPTSQAEWEQALEEVHEELGLTASVRGMLEVFLRGKTNQAEGHDPPDPYDRALSSELHGQVRDGQSNELAISNSEISFATWCEQWMQLARFDGALLQDTEGRIERILALWLERIPGEWQRHTDRQLMGPRYRRGERRGVFFALKDEVFSPRRICLYENAGPEK